MDTALVRNPKVIALAVILVLLAAYVGFSLGRASGRMAAAVGIVDAGEAPEGWPAALRAAGRLPPPEVTALIPEATADSNAAWTLLRPPEARDAARVRLLADLHDRVHGGDSLLAADPNTWNEALADTNLSRYVDAAAFRTFSNYVVEGYATGDVVIPRESDEPLLPAALPVPDYSGVEIGALSLALRIHRAVEERRYNEAMTDIRALLGIGRHLAARSPFLVGGYTGRRIVRLGADELAFYAEARGNTTLGGQAASILEWLTGAAIPPNTFGLLASVPDTALAIAGDPSVITAWRAEAVTATVLGQVAGLGHLLGGPDDTVVQRLTALRSDPDPQVAAFALVAVDFLRWFGDLGPWGRYRYLSANLGAADTAPRSPA